MRKHPLWILIIGKTYTHLFPIDLFLYYVDITKLVRKIHLLLYLVLKTSYIKQRNNLYL